MIPQIHDFTSYWVIKNGYAGILFGKNIVVYNDKVIDLNKELNDDSRINDINALNNTIFILLENNILYNFEDFLQHKKHIYIFE